MVCPRFPNVNKDRSDLGRMWLFLQLGLLFAGVLRMRALLFGFYLSAR